jgi:hypothetical protein
MFLLRRCRIAGEPPRTTATPPPAPLLALPPGARRSAARFLLLGVAADYQGPPKARAGEAPADVSNKSATSSALTEMVPGKGWRPRPGSRGAGGQSRTRRLELQGSWPRVRRAPGQLSGRSLPGGAGRAPPVVRQAAAPAPYAPRDARPGERSSAPGSGGWLLALAHDPANSITLSTLGAYPGLSNGRPPQNNVASPSRLTIGFRAMFHPF